MQIHEELAFVDWERAAALFEQVGWKRREPAELRLAFERSVVRAFAFFGAELVGMARAVGDGVYYATVVDVVVGTELLASRVPALNEAGPYLTSGPGRRSRAWKSPETGSAEALLYSSHTSTRNAEHAAAWSARLTPQNTGYGAENVLD